VARDWRAARAWPCGSLSSGCLHSGAVCLWEDLYVVVGRYICYISEWLGLPLIVLRQPCPVVSELYIYYWLF
jgi:hypothetical protein